MTLKSIHDQSHSMASSERDPMLSGMHPDHENDCVSGNSSENRGQNLTPAERDRVLWEMLERLSASAAHFAHQQRDSPDLTQQEKIDIAADILQTNPVTFLSRFGKFLQMSDLAYFQDAAMDSYEIGFYLKEIRHRCSHSDVIVKNRRYAALKELEAAGEYFSEEAMKYRDPLLYEQMVGQFLTEEEQERQATAAIDQSDLRFSTILLSHMDDTRRREVYKQQKEREECQEEEEEEEDSEEDNEDSDMGSRQNKQTTAEMDEGSSDAEDPPEISDTRATAIWRQQLREEFTAIMREQFLSGNDEQFDYSKVDDNPDYDSLATVAQDEEYKYFVSEDAQTVEESSSRSDAKLGHNAGSGMEQGLEGEGGGSQEDEEEEDYMLYEPSADLVARSAHFVKLGSWCQEDFIDNS